MSEQYDFTRLDEQYAAMQRKQHWNAELLASKAWHQAITEAYPAIRAENARLAAERDALADRVHRLRRQLWAAGMNETPYPGPTEQSDAGCGSADDGANAADIEARGRVSVTAGSAGVAPQKLCESPPGDDSEAPVQREAALTKETQRMTAREACKSMGIPMPSEEAQQRNIDRETSKRIAEEPPHDA